MIDIHCHILPMLDDGASDWSESLAMARLAVSSGVAAIVATPHFTGNLQGLEVIATLRSRYEKLVQLLARHKIPLKLLPGAEILCTPETISMARQHMLPTLGNSNYLLVEFLFNASEELIADTLIELAECGYRPVLAHPERYLAVQQNPELINQLFFQDIVIQLDKGSVMGNFGSEVQEAALWILRNGLAHAIASDAHGMNHRTTDMIDLRKFLLENFPPRYVEVLLVNNPARIVTNKSMFPTG